MGAQSDFVILEFSAYNELVRMGYKVRPQPPLWVKKRERFNAKTNSMEKVVAVYKTKYTVYFTHKQRSFSLLCFDNETVRRICTEIARHFVIQSSSIRLRYQHREGPILDKSHTLAQHRVDHEQTIYVEMRSPNGCWPGNNSNLHKYHNAKKKEPEDAENENEENEENQPQPLHEDDDENENEHETVCMACMRLISHYEVCPRYALQSFLFLVVLTLMMAPKGSTLGVRPNTAT